jgi:DNA-binding HxlR family transcriptional regulator
MKIELSEDWKEEMKKLREELASMKEQLREMAADTRQRAEEPSEKRRGIYIDIGNRVHDYVEDVMEGVAEGISGELERSVFVGPHHSLKVLKRRKRPERIKADPVKAASAMSALGNEHRLGILKELMHGGKYISDLQEKLPEITSSTLSSHLDVLQKAGLVVQEKVRGRYLITIPGRMAYKMATRIAKLIERESE